MDWMIPFQAAKQSPRSGLGLPARLLRHLFLSRHLESGMSVLEVGCGDGELTRFLASQSIRAVGCDPCGEKIADARRFDPETPFYCASPLEPLPVSDGEFHLAIARGLDVHRNDLNAADALRATANLLATLRPDGELIIVQRTDPHAVVCPDRDATIDGSRHLRSCFARHLGTFPGVVKVSLVADSLFEHRSVPQSLGFQPASGFITASLKLDSQRRTRADWQRVVEREIAKGCDSCCVWGVRSSSGSLPLSRAA